MSDSTTASSVFPATPSLPRRSRAVRISREWPDFRSSVCSSMAAITIGSGFARRAVTRKRLVRPFMDRLTFFAPPHPVYPSRREFLQRAGGGAGLLVLAGLLNQQGLLAADPSTNPLAPKKSHFDAKAKAVIWLFMNGGPSHVDTWDYKPELEKRHGQELKGFDKTTGFFVNQVGPLMKSPFKFQQHGACGAWVSDLFPNLAK